MQIKTFKIILICIIISFSFAIKVRQLPIPPTAADLSDHFGTRPSQNIYGPKEKYPIDLAREGIRATGGTRITPISNFDQEINSNRVASGDLLNTSYDASKIIQPIIAQPKLDVKTTLEHEAVVHTPVHVGNQITENTQHLMNKLLGKLIKKLL